MAEEEPPIQKAIRIDTDFIKGIQKQADSLATRATTIVIDEERGEGFELTSEAREAAVTLFMTLKALTIMIDWILESQDEFSAALAPETPPKENSCLIPAETFLKIVECTRISTDAQDKLEVSGISLVYH